MGRTGIALHMSSSPAYNCYELLTLPNVYIFRLKDRYERYVAYCLRVDVRPMLFKEWLKVRDRLDGYNLNDLAYKNAGNS